MKHGRQRAYKFTQADIAELKGISLWQLRADIKVGKLNPESLEDIIMWHNRPRTRSTKGKPIPQLEGKRTGRKRKVRDGE
jgi:hypothetical protein